MTLLTAKITKPRRSAATGSATKKTASQKHNAAHAAENRACSASALRRVRKTENRPLSCESGRFSGAGGGARTRTVLPPRDFKSLASACFATPARSVTSYHRSQRLSSTGNPAPAAPVRPPRPRSPSNMFDKSTRRPPIPDTHLLHPARKFDKIINYFYRYRFGIRGTLHL